MDDPERSAAVRPVAASVNAGRENAAGGAQGGLLVVLAVAVALGSFLLFVVQPLMGRMLLPWFGSVPAVWTSCLMFFQLVLLFGYAYADGLSRLPLRRQAVVHGTIMALVALGLLGAWLARGNAVVPDLAGIARVSEPPVLRVLWALSVAIGAPYFLLTTNTALLLSWLAASGIRRHPHALYALSNAASLAGLLGYPFVIEPLFGVKAQALGWTLGLGLYWLVMGYVVFRAWRLPATFPSADSNDDGSGGEVAGGTGAPTTGLRILWTGLAACGTILLMATTSRLTEDVSPMPLLWVVPLALYLATFIVAFGGWAGRFLGRLYPVLFVSAVVVAGLVLSYGSGMGLLARATAHLWVMAAVCLFCHGMLFRLRPGSAAITQFYLLVALGGACGGLFVGLLAPVLFRGPWELPAGLVLAGMLFAWICTRLSALTWMRALAWLPMLAAVGILWVEVRQTTAAAVEMSRNFYGVLRVCKETLGQGPTAMHLYHLLHGQIRHGSQLDRTEYRLRPNTYFTESSGVGRAILNHPRRRQGLPLRIGVVGMGIGTIAAYAEPGDAVRFYEINPAVIVYARDLRYFSYIGECKGDVAVVPGDARLSLEREAAEGLRHEVDVLVLDAFTGDAIPAHLLTAEAFRVYREHLAPGGIIAWHVTNWYVDFLPLGRAIAAWGYFEMASVISQPGSKLSAPSQWILFAERTDPSSVDVVRKANNSGSVGDRLVRMWTDDFNSLAGLIKTEFLFRKMP